jgi:hypothetical protein
MKANRDIREPERHAAAEVHKRALLAGKLAGVRGAGKGKEEGEGEEKDEKDKVDEGGKDAKGDEDMDTGEDAEGEEEAKAEVAGEKDANISVEV